MDKIFSIVFIKDGFSDISECYKILHHHNIKAVFTETHPNHWHFIIKKHTDEKIKAYILTEHCYLVVDRTEEDKEDKEDNDDFNDFVDATIDDYINIKTLLYKKKVLDDINKSATKSL